MFNLDNIIEVENRGRLVVVGCGKECLRTLSLFRKINGFNINSFQYPCEGEVQIGEWDVFFG